MSLTASAILGRPFATGRFAAASGAFLLVYT